MLSVDMFYLVGLLNSKYVDYDKKTYLIYAERLVDYIVEYVNSKPYELRQGVLLEVDNLFRDVTPGVDVVSIVERFGNDIEEKQRECCWDARVHIKAQYKRFGRGYCRVFFVMDLESTVDVFNNTDPDYYDGIKEALTEMVSDNPSSDVILAYHEKVIQESSETHHVPKLHDRFSQPARTNKK